MPKKCALCGGEEHSTERVAALEFCDACRGGDLVALAEPHDIVVVWRTPLRRFEASFGIAGQDPKFELTCVPQRWHHNLVEWVRPDVEVGDATFDDAVRIDTSDEARAGVLLSNVGIQIAVLTLLSDVRGDDLGGNRVELVAQTLRVSIRPRGTLQDRLGDLQLAALALAMHLRSA